MAGQRALLLLFTLLNAWALTRFDEMIPQTDGHFCLSSLYSLKLSKSILKDDNLLMVTTGHAAIGSNKIKERRLSVYANHATPRLWGSQYIHRVIHPCIGSKSCNCGRMASIVIVGFIAWLGK